MSPASLIATITAVTLGVLCCCDAAERVPQSMPATKAGGQPQPGNGAMSLKLQVEIGQKTFTATLEDNPATVKFRRMLPLTIFGLVLMIVTGVALFFAKPLLYYHNIWFRLKLIFLALAMINIVIFHRRVQMNQSEWDTLAVPPARTALLVPRW